MKISALAPRILADAGPAFRVQMKGTAAEIYIYGDIGESWFGDGITAKSIAEELKKIGAAETIDVHINSYGGDVFDGLAIYRQLVDHKAKVTTHVDGIAASAASVVAMAGDTINIGNGGQMMIHDAWTIAIGNADELRQVAERVDLTSAELAKLYAARTKQSETQVRDWMREELWMTADEAKARGFADNVVDFQRVAARAVPGFVNYVREFSGIAASKRPFRNMPEQPRSARMRTYADGIAVMEGRMAEARRRRASGRG